MRNESAETYLRQFAEALLRHVTDGRLTSDECSSRVRAVATAFEGTGVLDAELADRVHGEVDVALAARSPDAGTLPHPGRRAAWSAGPGLPGVWDQFARSAAAQGWGTGPGAGKGGGHGGSTGEIAVTPVGAALRVRTDNADDEDIYLLGYVSRPGRAWLTVAARTNERPARRPASPPSARNAGARRPAPGPFAGGRMTAVDDAGRDYDLGFSGGGGEWYMGRLTLHPAPPAGIGWLDVRCGTESARVDLTAPARMTEVTTLPATTSPAEAYLLRRAEALLIRPAFAPAEASVMADVVPALRAAGALASDSPVPGQVAALCEWLGAPGHPFTSPGPLPERWADFLAATGHGFGADLAKAGWTAFEHADTIDAARLAATLPLEAGITLVLAGLVNGADGPTIIFGGLHLAGDPAAAAVAGNLSMWVRDEAGGWHSASVSGWSSDGNGVSFQAVLLPPLTPATSEIEFYVTGPHEQIRAVLPLEWWSRP